MSEADIIERILANQQALVKSFILSASEISGIGFSEDATKPRSLDCQRCCLNKICVRRHPPFNEELPRYECGPWSGTPEMVDILKEHVNIKNAHL
jgi:hypothetical protein